MCGVLERPEVVMLDTLAPKGARLFCILARESRTAVIFRRGPSRWVQLIKWDTDKDTFEAGQWFHGRVYERRCDLSPKGDKLIYFAAKFKTTKHINHYSWTAISNPPWFTALTLWPKGDCWDGGGLFENARKVLLNHPPHEATLDPKFRIKGLVVRFNPKSYGEDDPIYSRRLVRDGWRLVQRPSFAEGAKNGWTATEPEIWEKINPRKRFVLRMILLGIAIKNDDWYALEFEVLDTTSGERISIGRASWADWDHRTHLVFAKGGKLFRYNLRSETQVGPIEIADFNDSKPQTIAPPEKAGIW